MEPRLSTAPARPQRSFAGLYDARNPRRAAHRIGDQDWCGPDAYLALAEIAIDADERDIALTALARAQEQGGEADDRELLPLLREVRSTSGEPFPETSLAGLLQRLAAA